MAMPEYGYESNTSIDFKSLMIKIFFFKKLIAKKGRENIFFFKKKINLAQTLANIPFAYRVGFVAE